MVKTKVKMRPGAESQPQKCLHAQLFETKYVESENHFSLNLFLFEGSTYKKG